MSDATQYNPEVSFRISVTKVYQLTVEGENPATYRVYYTVEGINDLGAMATPLTSYYLIDFIGSMYSILAIGSGYIEVEDSFRTGECPTSQEDAIIYKSVGYGLAPFIGHADLTFLHPHAKNNLNKWNLDILWKMPSRINVEWHINELLFSASGNDITYTNGSIIIHVWDLLSAANIASIGIANYHPERTWTITGATVTLANTNLFYAFAKIPIAEASTTATIVLTEVFAFEHYYDGYIYVLIGVINSGTIRSFAMYCGNAESASRYLLLKDVYDSTFTGKDLNVPIVDEAIEKLKFVETIELTAALMASLGIIEDTIVDGVTTKAPSQNAVFDALALKVNLSQAVAQTIGATGARLLKLWATSVEANTLDGAAFNLSNVALFLSFLRTGYAGTAGNVLMSQGISTTPIWTDKVPSLKIGGSTDYSEFEADGTLKMNGAATIWVDIDFPLVIRVPGTGRPVYTTVLGNLTMPKWAVNDWCEGDSQEIVHAVKEGSTGYFHIHVLTAVSDASDRYLKFELEFNYANFNAAWNGTNYANTPVDLLIPANTPIRTHLLFNIHTWSDIGHIGRHVKAYVKRVTATGTAPSVDPFCEMLQLHVECDTLGSRDVTSK